MLQPKTAFVDWHRIRRFADEECNALQVVVTEQTQRMEGALGQHGGQGKFTIKELPGIH